MGTLEKEILPKDEQEKIVCKVNDFVRATLGQDQKVTAIVAIGSVLDWKLGKYKEPKKGRYYSDIDLVVFVDDDFRVPNDWKLHLQSDFYTVYNSKEIDNILIQYWLCRKKDYQDPDKQDVVEKRGVPFKLEASRNRFLPMFIR